MEVVDDLSNPLSPIVAQTVTFTVAPISQVNDLAALRADVNINGTGGFYEVMSAPTVTFTRNFRNQKYAQDETAGILIDDFNGNIMTNLTIGDGITGLKGQTFINNEILHFIPMADASFSASSSIIPEVVTIETLLTKLRITISKD